MSTQTVLLCGVGGQGTILAADLLARAAMNAGCHVKVSEIHGMAQRGGAVTTVVRFGDEVDSMVCDAGCADVVVSFETTEALRNQAQLKEGGSLIVNDVAIKPLPVLTGRARMPRNARADLDSIGAQLVPAGVSPSRREASRPPTSCFSGPFRRISIFPLTPGSMRSPRAFRRKPST